MIPIPLLPDLLLRHIRGIRQDFFEQILVPQAVPWCDDLPFREHLCIKGETWHMPALFDTTPVAAEERTVQPNKAAVSPCGRFIYFRRVVPRGYGLDLYQGRRRGQVFFTADVIVPILAEVNEVGTDPGIWMSLTPSEILSLRPGVRLATGKVLVGGLGLGWLLQKVAQKRSVREIIVVEKNEGLINWLRPQIERVWPHVAEKTKAWIADDVFNHVGKYGDEVRTLLDVWQFYGEAASDKAFQKLKKVTPHLWAWGGFSP